ncbi:hypothetical protein OROGR_006413 [Orobanche gracilis]
MVATNLKAGTRELMEKRNGLEEEMNGIIERLCRPDGPGLSGNLLDSEGFPRADIDIPTVRADRHRLTGNLLACTLFCDRDIIVGDCDGYL